MPAVRKKVVSGTPVVSMHGTLLAILAHLSTNTVLVPRSPRLAVTVPVANNPTPYGPWMFGAVAVKVPAQLVMLALSIQEPGFSAVGRPALFVPSPRLMTIPFVDVIV
jgi:hypothetical protein